MNALITQMQNVQTEKFCCETMQLQRGEVGIVCTKSMEQGIAFIDTLLGLLPPAKGRVELLGMTLYELPERRRLALLANVCHVGCDLVSNLKVWENLSLQAMYHDLISTDEAERRLLAAIEHIQNKDDWLHNRLKALPDTLSSYARRMAGLLRSAILRPQLIVAEFLFDDLEEGPVEKLASMLTWLKTQDPEMGLLLVHLGPRDAVHLALHSLKASWIIQLEDYRHAVSEKH